MKNRIMNLTILVFFLVLFQNCNNDDVEILEASSIYGGRMRINTDFADFPIPLGAEWLETDPTIFQEIVNKYYHRSKCRNYCR